MPEAPAPLSGRRAQAARNDQKILASARAVFVADPSAPIAAVAQHAGVGISALYKRYGSKEDLLRKLCGDGLKVFNAAAEKALANDGDRWQAFAGFIADVVEADTHSLTLSLAGTFTPTEELFADSERAQELSTRVFQRAYDAGAVRQDMTVNDVAYIFEQLAAIRGRDEQRRAELRRRYLVVQLDGIRHPGDTPMPGPEPTWEEMGERWIPS